MDAVSDWTIDTRARTADQDAYLDCFVNHVAVPCNDDRVGHGVEWDICMACTDSSPGDAIMATARINLAFPCSPSGRPTDLVTAVDQHDLFINVAKRRRWRVIALIIIIHWFPIVVIIQSGQNMFTTPIQCWPTGLQINHPIGRLCRSWSMATNSIHPLPIRGSFCSKKSVIQVQVAWCQLIEHVVTINKGALNACPTVLEVSVRGQRGRLVLLVLQWIMIIQSPCSQWNAVATASDWLLLPICLSVHNCPNQHYISGNEKLKVRIRACFPLPCCVAFYSKPDERRRRSREREMNTLFDRRPVRASDVLQLNIGDYNVPWAIV